MRAAFPITLDNGLVVRGTEEPFMISDDPDFDGVSGSDANGDRATHIVGFDGVDLLKKCTRSDCENPVQPREAGFGSNGRCTSRSGMRRDQAQCIICRGRPRQGR